MDITFEASRKVRFLSFPMSAGKAEIWLMSHQSSSKDAKEPTTAIYTREIHRTLRRQKKCTGTRELKTVSRFHKISGNNHYYQYNSVFIPIYT